MTKGVVNMQKLLNYGNKFLKESTWEDLVLIKLCLWAMGIIWGMTIPRKARKPVAFITVIVFVATYIPLMLKFFRVIDDRTLSE